MITINGLSKHQVALLDEMWACESMEDLDEFMETLDSADQAEAERLQRMILLAEMDNIVAEMPLTEARQVLDKFRL
jgi:hypothetical protein